MSESTTKFEDRFNKLTGNPPLVWQTRLYKQWFGAAFSGYRSDFKTKPLHAALLEQNSCTC